MKRFRKKKQSVADQARHVIAEPVRKSILDVINTNLGIASRVTFLHRVIYVGQYSFSGNQNIVTVMEENYKECNSGYTVEPLSGVMLYYQHYFCIIAEAPERVLNKYVALLFEKHGTEVTNVKLLAAVHHIKGRFWNEWMSYFGRPPQRVEQIDPESDLDTSMWYVKDCCEKMYRFANAYISDQLKLRSKYLLLRDDDEDDEVEKSFEASHIYKSKTTMVERDTYSDCLPEIKLLDFLVSCKYLTDLKQYHDYYKYIGQSMDFTRKGWPAPTIMVPYNVFDSPYDPIEDLPTATQQSTQEEEKEDFLVAEESGSATQQQEQQ